MIQINPVASLAAEGDIAVIILDSPPVNALSEIMREGLIAALTQAETNARAIVLLCAGRTFIAGADISEFGKVQTGATLRDVQDAFDRATVPIVAALHGTVLGGGLETAMCAHYRIAVPSTKMGQPEVALGLVPGAGGTQRLPRLVGVEKSLEMITGGKPITAKEALALGLIDAIAPDDALKESALDFARALLAGGQGIRRTRDMNEKISGVDPKIFPAFRASHDFHGFEAPGEAIKCIEAATKLPFDEGLEFERVVFEARKISAQSLAQRYAFFAERKAGKVPGLADDVAPLAVHSVGVIGAGLMGQGIALAFANAGLPVVLVENNDAVLAAATDAIAKQEKAAPRISFTRRKDDLASCDLVVEAVFERAELKKEIFADLGAVAKKSAILASNASFLELDDIAAPAKRPEQIVGLHFFSPVRAMRLLEIVRGAKTSHAVLATALKLAKALGKVGVVVGPGFVANRMLMTYLAQADAMVLEGASPFAVDQAMRGFGFAMGPFAMADLAGLDLDPVEGSLRDLLCQARRRGQKDLAGYYDYDESRRATPSPVTEKLVAEWRDRKAVAPRVLAEAEIRERCLYAIINEGAAILAEGKAARASDLDVIWLNGFGFPAWRGGPMYHADSLGLGVVVAGLKTHGLAPAPLLEKLATQNGSFTG